MTENRLSCGPFMTGSEARLFHALAEIGLRLADGHALVRCLAEPSGGLRLEARGEGVRGYLLADDGEEAELQDIKRLVLMCCRPRLEVSFSGSALIAKETVMVISSRASHDGRTVKWASTRTLLGAASVRTLRHSVG
jgi:hypothetical protein